MRFSWRCWWLTGLTAVGSSGTCPNREGSCDEAGLFQIQATRYNLTSHVPYGTNFGGWLCLEDWFFSGDEGRFVSTSDPEGQGVCLPPLLQGQDKRWPSEGILVQRLKEQVGEKLASQVFEAHRNSFIHSGDLKALAKMGVNTVRIPVVWTLFADALAPLASIYGEHNPNTDHKVVPDPYYPKNASLVTIPRKLLEDLFSEGHKYGIKFLLDIHAFPGGSSDGTYNGIWPLKPVFWKKNMQVGNGTSLQKAGLMIVAKAIEWLESLKGDALEAVEGLSPMNEPGHLAGFQTPSFAPIDEVLAWLSQTIHMFRHSKLPSQGKKLYMQIIETAFPDNSFWDKFPPWWKQQTSVTDREQWAVADMHWYTAWGTKAGVLPELAAVSCSQPVDKILEVLKPGIEDFAKKFAEEIPGLKATTEFSASTNADTLLACQPVDLTRPWMEAQVEALKHQGIMPFFWSFKMPYGQVFQSGWSLRKIMGVEEAPPFQCALGAGLQGADAKVPCFAGSCD